MAATVIFNDLTNPTVTVKAPSHPYSYEYRNRQKIGYAKGGTPKVADWGDDDQVLVLHWVRLNQTDHDALSTFIRTTINWAETSFTFTDPFSVAHTTMRCVSKSWNFRLMPRGHELYEGSLTIRKDL